MPSLRWWGNRLKRPSGQQRRQQLAQPAWVALESLEQRRLLSTSLISSSVLGPGGGNADSEAPSISDNGRYVAFVSYATDLVAGMNEGGDVFDRDVFLHDRNTGQTVLVSRKFGEANTGASGESYGARISGDGSKVVFVSEADDLVGNDSNFDSDVFVYDVATGTIELVSVSTGGGSGDAGSFDPVISYSGNHIAFTSYASDLTAASDGNNSSDVFVRDYSASGGPVTLLASRDALQSASGNGDSFHAFISSDGSTVAFVSDATDLVDDDPQNQSLYAGYNVYAYDVASGALMLISRNSSGTGGGNGWSFAPVVNANGTSIAYKSNATNLVGNDNNAFTDIYHWSVDDLGNTQTRLVSANPSNTSGGNAHSGLDGGLESRIGLYISANGNIVAFSSSATNLVATPSDSGSFTDTFVRDVNSGLTTLASITPLGTTGNGHSTPIGLSADGTRVLMISDADDLFVDGSGNFIDTNGEQDLYLRDLVAGTTTLVSINAEGTAAGDWGALTDATITPDGTTVAFASFSSDLIAGETTWWGNIFIAFSGTTAPVNQPPVGAADYAVTTEDNPVTINVLANDSDPDGDLFSVYDVTQGAFGSVVINADNTVTYTPGANFTGTDTFTYRVSDSHGALSGWTSVTVTVLSPQESSALLAEQIRSLQSEGKLTARQTALMLNRLGHVVHFLSRNNPSLSLALGAREQFVEQASNLADADRDPLVSGIDQIIAAFAV